MSKGFDFKRIIASILTLMFLFNTLDFIPGMAIAIAEQSKIEEGKQPAQNDNEAGSESTPVQESAPEVKEEAAPAQESAPEVKEAVPVQESAPEVKEESAPAQESVPDVKEEAPVQESTPEVKEEAAPAQESAPEVKEAAVTVQESVLETQPEMGSVSQSEETVTVPDNNDGDNQAESTVTAVIQLSTGDDNSNAEPADTVKAVASVFVQTEQTAGNEASTAVTGIVFDNGNDTDDDSADTAQTIIVTKPTEDEKAETTSVLQILVKEDNAGENSIAQTIVVKKPDEEMQKGNEPADQKSVENTEDKSAKKETVENAEGQFTEQEIAENTEDKSVNQEHAENAEDKSVNQETSEDTEDKSAVQEPAENAEDKSANQEFVENAEDKSAIQEIVENAEDKSAIQETVENAENQSADQESAENAEDKSVGLDTADDSQNKPEDQVGVTDGTTDAEEESSETVAGLFVLPENTENLDPESADVVAEEMRTLDIQVGDYVITAYGNIPEGAELQAVEIPAETAEKMSGKKPLFAYDIRLVVDGQVWQPEEHGTDVKISLKDMNGDLDSKGNIAVLHVKADLMEADGSLSEEALDQTVQDLTEGSVETEVISTETQDGAVSFDTTSFSGFSATLRTKLEEMLLKKVESQEQLDGKVQLSLSGDTVYEEDSDNPVTFTKAYIEAQTGKTVKDGFEVEVVAEDAGSDNLQADGSTVIKSDINIQGINVRLIGVSIAAGNVVTVESAKLEYYGTQADDAITVKVNENGKASIVTGTGDDTVDLDISAGAGNVDIKTGEDNDNVSVMSSSTTEKSTSYVTIDLGEGNNTAAIDVSVAAAVSDMTVKGDEDSDSNVHLTGKLKKQDDNPISGTEEDMTLTAETGSLRIHTENIDNVTDTLENKNTINVNLDEQSFTADQPFTDYILKASDVNAGNVSVKTKDGKRLALSNVVINAENGDHLIVEETANVLVEGVKLVLRAKNITVNGTLKADAVRVEALDGNAYIEGSNRDPEHIDATINDTFVLGELYKSSDKATIEINEKAAIYSSGDVMLVAKVGQEKKGYSDTPVADVKEALAGISILGKIYAGVTDIENTESAPVTLGTNGSVLAQVQINSDVGYINRNVSTGYPELRMNYVSADASVQVGVNAEITAAKDIILSSQSRINNTTHAEQKNAAYFVGAVSVLNNDVRNTVQGKLDAKGNIELSAQGDIENQTIADRLKNSQGDPSGYAGVTVATQNVSAKLTGDNTAVKAADGDVKISASALETVDNTIDSADKISESGNHPVGFDMLKNMLKWFDGRVTGNTKIKEAITRIDESSGYVDEVIENKDVSGDDKAGKLKGTGTVSVVVVDNNSDAVVDSGVTVNSGNSTTVNSDTRTTVNTIADGTAVSSNDIGVSVAVTVANAKSNSEIKGSVYSTGNVNVDSSANGNILTEADAGSSKSDTGFAGGIAVQVASNDSRAAVETDSKVMLDGELRVKSDAASVFTVKGDASGKDGGKTGIGAGIAVAVNGSDSVAEVKDGATLTNKAESNNFRGISVIASQKLKDTVSAKAGAEGGVAVVPAVAVDVTGGKASAYFGSIKGYPKLSGNMAVSAGNEAEHAIEADASAGGKGKAGIGTAIAVSVLGDESIARLGARLEANQVTVAAETVTEVTESATAGAEGGKKEGEDADSKVDSLLGSASKLTEKNKSSAVSSEKVQDAITKRQKAETSEGSVGVAAAVAVNVQDSVSKAELMDGSNIIASGLVSVTAVNGTTSKVKADASTTNSNIGIGAGVAVNVISLNNIARLGNGYIRAAMLKVSATTKESKQDEDEDTEKADTYDHLATLIGQMTEEYMNKLISEMGLDQFVPDLLLDTIIADITKEIAQSLIDTAGLNGMYDDLSAKYKNAISRIESATGMTTLPDALAESFMEAMGEAYDLSGLTADQLKTLRDKVVVTFKSNLQNQIETKGSSVLDGVRNGMVEYLKDNCADLFSGLFAGQFNADTEQVFEQARSVLSRIARTELKALVVKSFEETVRTVDVPGITTKNVGAAVNAFRDGANVFTRNNIDSILGKVSDTVTDIYSDLVCDYRNVITKLTRTDFSGAIANSLRAAAKKASVTLTNSAVAALTDHFDLKLEAENDPDGHVIDTQAISGAGAKEVGVAGSVAITVLNAETSAVVADYDSAIEVNDGDVIVEAKEVRNVRNVASAALDANGDAAANKSADDAANADVAESDNTLSSGHVTVNLGAGATGTVSDSSADRPKVYVTMKNGYKAPDEVSYSYTASDGTEKEGKVAVTKSGDQYVIDTNSGALKNLDAATDIRFTFTAEEILHDIPAPDASLSDVKLAEGAVTVSVPGREPEGNKIRARQDELVEIRIDKSKIENGTVSAIGYSYTDAEGKVHDVEINPDNGKAAEGKERAFTLVSSSESELVYTIAMPDADITAIVVACQKNEDGNTDAKTESKDGTGKSVGVGASFSMVYGDTKTTVEIGKRDFNVGSLTVNAESVHTEDIASAAGSDPLEGNWSADDAKKTAVDASVALNILDNTIKATVDEGKTLTIMKGDFALTANEVGKTETTSSAFSVGEKTAVGASVALNIADSTVNTELNALTTRVLSGNATVEANSHSEDVTKAIATAMGADIGRTMAKLGQSGQSIADNANKVLDGSYIDSLGKDDKNATGTNKKINERLDKKKGDEGQNTHDNVSVSSNALRSQGVKLQDENAGSEGTTEAKDQIKEQNGTEIGDVGGEKGSKVQVAAAVGITITSHDAAVKVGHIEKSKDITVAAENTANFNTMGTGAAMSLAEKANSIALGVAVSVSENKATVSVKDNVKLENAEDVTLKSTLTQNMDGEFLGKLAAQALSGSVAGKDSAVSIGGAVSVVVTKASAETNVGSGVSIEGGNIVVEATDKSKTAARAGGLSLSKGSSVGMGIASTTIVSGNTVTAVIGDRTSIKGKSFKLNAEKKAVTDADFSQVIDRKYLFTDSSNLTDEQRKTADTGLIDVHKEGDKNYSVDVNLSSEKLLKAVDALNFLSSQNTYAEAITGSVAIGKTKASIAGSFAVAVTKNVVNATLGNGVTVETREGNADLNASNGATTRIIAGSLSAAPAKASVGATVAVLVNSDAVSVKTGEMDASLDNIKASKGDVNVSAEQTGDAQVFTAAIAVAAGSEAKAAAGGAVNVIVNKSVAETNIGNGMTVYAGGNASITSKTKYDLTLVSGSANVTAVGGSVAAGGTVNVIVDKASALTTLGLTNNITAEKNVTVTSDVSDAMISGAASASVAASASGKSGVGAVNVIVSKSVANTTVGGNGGSIGTLTAKAGDVAVKANNDAGTLNVTLAVAGASGLAIGGNFNVDVFNRESTVNMTNSTVKANQNLYIQSAGRDSAIMAGLAAAGAVSGTTVSGNAGVLVGNSKVQTILGQGITADARKNAIVESYYSDYAVDAAGTIALSASSGAYGVTGLVAVKSNDVKTSISDAHITSGYNSGKALSSDTVTGLYVGANARETQILGAAGVAAAGGTTVNGVVDVLVNKNSVITDASKAVLKTTDDNANASLKHFAGIDIKAADDTRQLLLAGGLNVSGGVGVGAAVVTLVSDKTVQTKAHNIEAKGSVDIASDNRDDVDMIAISAGASFSSAVDVGAVVQVMDSDVLTEVGTNDISSSREGGISITANNNTNLTNVAVAVAGSASAAVTPVAAVTVFGGTTESKLKEGSYLTAKDDVDVKAVANKEIDTYAIGAAASGGAGISGAAAVVVGKKSNNTAAMVEKNTNIFSTDGDMNVEAQSDFELSAATAAVGASSTAVAVNAAVSVLKGSVTAEMAGHGNVGGDANVRATAGRDVQTVGLDLAAGSTGVGVNVMVLVTGTKMSQDAADMMAYGNSGDKGTKTFDSDKLMTTIAKNDNGGSKYYSDKMSDKGDTLADYMAGNGHYESKMNLGSGDNKFDGASGYRSADFDNSSFYDKGDAQRGENLDAADTSDISNAKAINTYIMDTPEDSVIARLTETANIDKANTLNVTASEPVRIDLFGVTAAGGVVGVGVTTAVAVLHSNVFATSLAENVSNVDELNVTAESRTLGNVEARSSVLKDLLGDIVPGDGGIRALGASIGAGKVAVAVAAGVVLTDNVTRAVLGRTVAGVRDVNVTATQDYGDILAGVGTGSVGAVAVGASVAVVQSDAEVSAVVEKDTNARITAQGDVKISTNVNLNGTAGALTAGIGALSVNGALALAINRTVQNTGVGSGANINAANINVTGKSSTNASSNLIGASLGGNVSLSGAVSQVDAKLNTYVDHSSLTAYNGTVEVFNDVTGNAVPKSNAYGLNGVSVTGNVLLAFNSTTSLVQVAESTINAKTLNVVADLQGAATANESSMTIAGTVIGLNVNYADMRAENQAELKNSTVTVQDLMVRTGRSNSTTIALAKTRYGKVGAFNLGLNAAIARNATKSYARIEGGNINMANIDVRSSDSVTADAGMTGLDIGMTNIVAGVAVALNDADTRTEVKLDRLTAKDVTFKTLHNAVNTASFSTGGGSLVEARVNVAAAYGKSKGIVDVEIGTLSAENIAAATDAKSTTTANGKSQSYSAISAAATAGAAYSKDDFSTRVKLGGTSNLRGKIDIRNTYNVTVKADVTPSAGGVKVNLAAVEANFAIAKNTASAVSELIVDGKDENIQRNGGIGDTLQANSVNVLTQGSSVSNAILRPAEITLSGASLGVNYATADMSMVQSAAIQVKGKDTRLKALNEISVDAIADQAEATASLGNAGQGSKEVELSLASGTASRAYAKENLSSSATVQGVSGKAKIFTDSLSIHSKVGNATKAIADSNGANGVSLLTAGDLRAESVTSDSYNVSLKGLDVIATGNVDLTADSRTVSKGYGGVPGGYKLLDFGSSNTSASIGSSGKYQTVKVEIGDGVKLSAGRINLMAQNSTDIEAEIERASNFSIAEVHIASQPTYTYVDTDVIVGNNAEISAVEKMNIAAKSTGKAFSVVNNSGSGFIASTSTLKGENSYTEKINTRIGDGAKLTVSGTGDLSISAQSGVNMEAQSLYTGDFLTLGEGSAATSGNTMTRTQNLYIGKGAQLTSGSTIYIENDIGSTDSLYTRASEDTGSGLVSFVKTDAWNSVNSVGNLSVAQGANITANDLVSIRSRFFGSYTVESDVDTGVSVQFSPVANANNYVTLKNVISINSGSTGGSERTRITSKMNAVKIESITSDAPSIATRGNATVKGVGSVYSWGNIGAYADSQINLDNADLTGHLGTSLLADVSRAILRAISSAGLKGVGYESPTAKMWGNINADINSSNTGNVNGGTNFTHVAKTSKMLQYEANPTGWDTSKGYPDVQITISLNDWCSFCNAQFIPISTDGMSFIGYDSTQNDFFKTLAPVNDIARNGTDESFITKANYGQEVAKVASAIYMLNVSRILPENMIIKEDSLPGYQMWINPLTQQEVSLLPNATRLYRGAKLEYVSEILAGDVYGNGGQHEIDVITALNDHAFRKPVVSIGASGSLDFSSGVLVLPDLSVFELYQHEVSGSWLIGQMQSGLIRRMDADQTLIDAFVYGDGTKPANWSGTRIIDNITEGSKVNGLRCFWIGDTPETAADDEQILVGVLLDEKNDEIKAFRTSRARIADGIANTDVSIYIFRDTNADRMGEEKYDAFFFDTPAGEASVIRVMTDVLTGQEIVVPKPIRIVLRGFSVNGADYPVYSLSDHLFAMCDGSDGSVKMFDNFYHATFNGDVFDSNYIRIEGIMNNDLSITIKKGQPVWSELKDASEMDESVDTIEM